MTQLRALILIGPLLALGACSEPQSLRSIRDAILPTAPAPEAAAPVAGAPPVPDAMARTPDQLDTTTAADRDAAAVDAGGQDLGQTTATLGDPTQPGFWLETPLVTDVAQGRISYEGRWISVELRPSGGAAGSGSRISLAAMRLLDAPLTGIIDIRVARG